MKKQTGITIVALVVTIIILLILAGIVISLSIGKNGIIERAKFVGEKYQNAANNEQKELNSITKYFGSKDFLEDIGTNENEQNNIKELTPIITDIKSHGFTINVNVLSDETNIVCYTFIVNGEVKQSSSEKICTVTGLDANKENEIIVIAIDNFGNSRKSVIKGKTKDEIIFTKEYLEQGQRVGNVDIRQNVYKESDGLSITGTSNRPANCLENWDLYPVRRWYKEIDITDYNTLQFYAKKGQDHGSVYIYIDDKRVYNAYFSKLSTTWTLHSVDLSEYEGKHVISIVGGYIDNTGSSSSNTQFCDIKLTTI